MPAMKPVPAKHDTPADSTGAVTSFMQTLDHPYKDVIELIRKTILSVDPSIREGIKWNSPSFRTDEYFATANLRSKESIGIILHLGAKVRETVNTGIIINDPESLLKWQAKDRAIVSFSSTKDFNAKKNAFKVIIHQWLTFI
jgi:hypothetical protein